jgi:hypothetical protein
MEELQQVPDLNDVHQEIEVITADQATPVQPSNILSSALVNNTALADVLTAEPNLAAAALDCLQSARAPKTVKGYLATVNSFKSFCSQNNYSFPLFTATAVTRFILYHAAKKTAFGFIAKIKPALVYLEKAMNRPSVFNKSVDLILTGARRRARARSGPAKKAPEVTPKDIATAVQKIFPAHDNVGYANPVHLRTAFRMVILYHTLCRDSCFSKLQAKHFEEHDQDIIITFPSSKTDQLHNGRRSCLAATGTPMCPVRITKLYFQRFGLRMGSQHNDTTFLNFQLRKEAGRIIPIPQATLSPSQMTADLRNLLSFCGRPNPMATGKSIKAAGVTSAYEAGATDLEVCQAGRWETPAIPLRYKLNSNAFKRTVALKIPSLDTI